MRVIEVEVVEMIEEEANLVSNIKKETSYVDIARSWATKKLIDVLGKGMVKQ